MDSELNQNALRRKLCYETYKEFLEAIWERGGKGQRNRRIFYSFVYRIGSTGFVFPTEEIEYNVIGKFGRNMWTSSKVINSFTEEEKKIVMIICEMFGTFDY
jgi:hypothetical protein